MSADHAITVVKRRH